MTPRPLNSNLLIFIILFRPASGHYCFLRLRTLVVFDVFFPTTRPFLPFTAVFDVFFFPTTAPFRLLPAAFVVLLRLTAVLPFRPFTLVVVVFLAATFPRCVFTTVVFLTTVVDVFLRGV